MRNETRGTGKRQDLDVLPLDCVWVAGEERPVSEGVFYLSSARTRLASSASLC
jgi:hypothetical protein